MHEPRARGHGSPSSASTSSTTTPTSRSTSRSTTPASPTDARVIVARDRGRGGRARGAERDAGRASTASWSPAASACAASRARSRRSATPANASIPFFGICLGMQCAVDRVRPQRARPGGRQQHRVRPDDASIRSSACWTSRQPVTRAGRHDAAGRLALRPDAGQPGPRRPTAPTQIDERHRHRYEFNNAYRQQFEENGLVVTGTSPDGKLVEIIELPDHPWFLAVQFHPEFKSKPTQAHPAVPRLHRRRPRSAARRTAGRAGRALRLEGRPDRIEEPIDDDHRPALRRPARWVELDVRGRDRSPSVRPGRGSGRAEHGGRLGRAGVLGHPDQRPLGASRSPTPT